MSMATPMSKADKQWQAESDARTLAEAEAIKQDSSRLNKAATAAKTLAKDKMVEAKAMVKIAKKKK